MKQTQGFLEVTVSRKAHLVPWRKGRSRETTGKVGSPVCKVLTCAEDTSRGTTTPPHNRWSHLCQVNSDADFDVLCPRAFDVIWLWPLIRQKEREGGREKGKDVGEGIGGFVSVTLAVTLQNMVCWHLKWMYYYYFIIINYARALVYGGGKIEAETLEQNHYAVSPAHIVVFLETMIFLNRRDEGPHSGTSA